MSALAAIDRALAFLEGLDGVHSDALEARAAVAELVEAARRCATLRPHGKPYHEAHTDLRAALAKFGSPA